MARNNKTYIIAEIGINHNGDLKIAKKLIDVSVDCGCDAVKFQKRDINSVYSKEFLDDHRESPWGKTQRAQKERLEFNYDEYKKIDEYCKKKEINWFASAWDLKSIEFLTQFDFKFNKVPSVMIVDKNFLKYIAKQKKYTFISTGMSTFKNIDTAVKIFKENNCTYLEFEKRLLEIYSISKESYFSKMDKKPDYVMRFNKNNSTINLIREKLLQLGVNQN